MPNPSHDAGTQGRRDAGTQGRSDRSRCVPASHTPRGLVFDVDKFAIHDGPGIRTTVYLKGCPLRCWWCHSPESQLGQPQLLYLQRKCTGCGLCLDQCPEGALRRGDVPVEEFLLPRGRASLTSSYPPTPNPSPHGGGEGSTGPQSLAAVEVDWSRCTDCGDCVAVCYPGALKMAGEWMTVDQVVREVEKDVAFFQASGGGVTLTGGEVAQQSAFAYEVLRTCRARGIHTAVETAGLAPWRVFARLSEVTDLFLYDLKQMDDARHWELTGVPNGPILANLRRLADGARRDSGADGDGYEIVVRVPCIPGLTDDEANIRAITAFVRELGLRSIHLLPYNASAAAKYAWIGRPYLLPELTTQSPEQMQRLAAICAAAGLSAQIGG